MIHALVEHDGCSGRCTNFLGDGKVFGTRAFGQRDFSVVCAGDHDEVARAGFREVRKYVADAKLYEGCGGSEVAELVGTRSVLMQATS